MNATTARIAFALVTVAVTASIRPTPAPAATVNWVGPSGGFWDIAGNWSPGLPGSTDDALLGAFDTEFRTGSVTIRSFTGTGLLRVTGGTLQVTQASSIGSVVMSGGSLGGSGDITVSGVTTLSGGNMV